MSLVVKLVGSVVALISRSSPRFVLSENLTWRLHLLLRSLSAREIEEEGGRIEGSLG